MRKPKPPILFRTLKQFSAACLLAFCPGIIAFGLLIAAPSIRAVESNALPDRIAAIKPSVVAIGTYMTTRTPKAVILGTGFAVADGKTIITNAHVVEKQLDDAHLEQYAVFFRKDNSEHMLIAKRSTIDEDHDIAVLNLNEGYVPPLEIGDSTQVREGEEFAFTGYPIGMVLGLFPVTHHCFVSSITPNVIPQISSSQLNVTVLKRLQTPYDIFQLDATAYPGSSGSPMYNIQTGKVVGIINKVFVQTSKENALTNPSGISYAIPSQYIRKLLSQ
jgi:serine protease Do